jgi:hypothetical protein
MDSLCIPPSANLNYPPFSISRQDFLSSARGIVRIIGASTNQSSPPSAFAFSSSNKYSMSNEILWPIGRLEELEALLRREDSEGYGEARLRYKKGDEDAETAQAWRHKICDW